MPPRLACGPRRALDGWDIERGGRHFGYAAVPGCREHARRGFARQILEVADEVRLIEVAGLRGDCGPALDRAGRRDPPCVRKARDALEVARREASCRLKAPVQVAPREGKLGRERLYGDVAPADER